VKTQHGGSGKNVGGANQRIVWRGAARRIALRIMTAASDEIWKTGINKRRVGGGAQNIRRIGALHRHAIRAAWRAATSPRRAAGAATPGRGVSVAASAKSGAACYLK